MEPNTNNPNLETNPSSVPPVPTVDESTTNSGSQQPPIVIGLPGTIYGPSPAATDTLSATPAATLPSNSGLSQDSTAPTSPELTPLAVNDNTTTTLSNLAAPSAPANFGQTINASNGDMGAPAGQMYSPQSTSGTMDTPALATTKARKIPKPAIFAAVGVLLLALAGAGYYFGYYTNSSVVYGQSLSNAGKAYDKLITYIDVQSKTGNKGYGGEGTYKIVSGSTTTDGKASFKTDGVNSDTTFDVGFGVTRVSVETRTIKQPASLSPDIYLKATGIKGLGGLLGSPQLGTTLDQLEGKWIVADHTLIDNLTKSAAQAGGGMTTPTRNEVIDELHAFGKVNQQYVFSTKKDKAVTTVVKTYGVETVEGHKTIHYKVAFVKDNVKKYITAQRDALNSSQLGNWIKKNNYKTSVDSSYDQLVKSADNIKSSDTIDVWSDINTRVLYKVRVSDKTNPATNYVDLGLDYKNSASYPFFISTQSKDSSSKNNGSLVATLDTNTSSLTLKATFRSTGSSSSSADATFTFKPSSDTLKIAVPSGALPLAQVFSQLGLGDPLSLIGPSSASTSPSTGSTDTRRQLDIQSLQVQAEAFFSQNGYYPSLAQFNSAAWRKSNMPSFDPSTLKDPDSSVGALVGAPAVHAYAYQAKAENGASCDGISSTTCFSYTLTATLSNGAVYTKAYIN